MRSLARQCGAAEGRTTFLVSERFGERLFTMKNLSQAPQEFLSQKRIAVVGVSRTGSGAASAIFRKLRETGHETYAVNSKGGEVDGISLHRDLTSIPTPDGVVVVTPPPAALGVVEECARLGIKRVWLHRSLDGGSISPEAINYCRSAGISVIPGACPMMFCEPVDFGHRCIRWILRLTGKLPR
jgi:predicted CoA-binding protein